MAFDHCSKYGTVENERCSNSPSKYYDTGEFHFLNRNIKTTVRNPNWLPKIKPTVAFPGGLLVVDSVASSR